MNEKLFIECLDLPIAIDAMNDLKEKQPDTFFSLIWSRNKYYVEEDDTPFMRNDEYIAWEGLAKNFNPDDIKT